MLKLRQSKKMMAWVLCVTIPFYIQSAILLSFLLRSLEKNKRPANQISALFYDLSFMVVVPMAVIVYGKKSRSSIILCYLYL